MSFTEIPEIPEWTKGDHLSPVEDWVDRVVGDLGGIAGFLLGPIVHALKFVLHPIIAFVDRTFDYVWGVLHGAYNTLRITTLAAIVGLSNGIRVLQRNLDGALSGIRSEAAQLVNQLRAEVNGAASDLVRGVSSRVDQLTAAERADITRVASQIVTGDQATLRTAAGWVDDAIHYASRVADGARTLIAQAVAAVTHDFQVADSAVAAEARAGADNAVHYASKVADGARTYTDDAVHVLKVDVVDPIGGKLDAFLGGPWRDAQEVIGKLRDALEWIVWVTRHLVPETVATYRAIKGLADSPLDEIARSAAVLTPHR